MAKTPKLHIRTASKGSTKKSEIGAFDRDVNDLFDAVFASRLTGLVKFDIKAVRQRLNSTLTTMYIEGIKENIGALIGGYLSNPASPSSWTFSDPNLGIDKTFLRKNVIGFTGMSTLQPSGQQLRYHPLARKTVLLKSKLNRRGSKPNLNRARAFFLDSGDLKKTLLLGIRKYVTRTGVVQVSARARTNGRFVKITDPKATIRLADFQIKLLPKVSTSQLPGLQSGDWTHDTGTVDFERMLGFDTETLAKLGNLGDSYAMRKRPLMQPIFTFYTLYRAPAIIARELPSLIKQAV